MAKPEDRDYDEQELWKIAEQACTDIIKREDIYQLADTPENMCTTVLMGGSKESVFEYISKLLGQLAQTKWDQSLALTSMARYYQGYPVVTGEMMGNIQNMNYRITNETVEKDVSRRGFEKKMLGFIALNICDSGYIPEIRLSI